MKTPCMIHAGEISGHETRIGQEMYQDYCQMLKTLTTDSSN